MSEDATDEASADTSEGALVKAELTNKQRDAQTMIDRGIGLLISVPIMLLVGGFFYAVVGGVASTIAMIACSLCVVVGLVAGTGIMIVGGVQYRRLEAQIRGWPRQLPEARVVERRHHASESGSAS
jgi:hypothetical protein